MAENPDANNSSPYMAVFQLGSYIDEAVRVFAQEEGTIDFDNNLDSEYRGKEYIINYMGRKISVSLNEGIIEVKSAPPLPDKVFSALSEVLVDFKQSCECGGGIETIVAKGICLPENNKVFKSKKQE